MRYLLYALLLSCGVASAQEVRELTLPYDVPLQLTQVPAGEFTLGSPETEPDRDGDEGPQQEVSVPSFWLGTYEVTQRQWLAVMGYNPSMLQETPDHLDKPVENVSWNECQVFLTKLNALGLGSFRLPTEAEWEYACRAGTTTAYYFGDYQAEWHTNKFAWMNSRSMATSHPVGTKPANPWGLHDMLGNVWEWTSTVYTPGYEAPPKQDDLRVFRGGSWYDFGNSQRCANRHKHAVHEKFSVIGLRLVWENE